MKRYGIFSKKLGLWLRRQHVTRFGPRFEGKAGPRLYATKANAQRELDWLNKRSSGKCYWDDTHGLLIGQLELEIRELSLVPQ